ncbi:MAG: lipoyl(octanoyl) transferase LipB [Candidatus Neomarinimicrobiota bacterium]
MSVAPIAIRTSPSGDNLAPVVLKTPVDTAGVSRTAGQIRTLARGRSPAIFYLGRQPYRPLWELQRRLHAWRVRGVLPDTVLLLEHEPVYTLGKNAGTANLLARRPGDAQVVQTDRGGDITFHGPGQLVGYPIIDLRSHRPSVTWYLRGLEGVLIRLLGTYGVQGHQIEGLTGVFLGDRKVAALGVRLARWTTMHGFALNIAVPQPYFDGIIPCGLLDYGVVNLNEALRQPTSVREAAERVSPILREFLRG